jgi:thiol-disulfide isomerase/thioredoxin
MQVRSTLIRAAALGGFLAAAAMPVLAGSGASFLGEQAPEIGVGSWVNADGRVSLADHRGGVVLLEFWSTSCAPARSSVAPLIRLQREYGTKGLTVIGLTSESPEPVWRFLAHEHPDVNYKIGFGGGSEYGVTGIPHAYLIDGTGKVVWEGSPGGLSKKTLSAALKTVKAPTKDALLKRARARIERGKGFLAEGLVLRASDEFEHVARSGLPAVETEARKLLQSVREPEHVKELLAQKSVAKLLGSSERLTKKLKRKQLEALSKKLRKLAESLQEKTPHAARIANTWSKRLAPAE